MGSGGFYSLPEAARIAKVPRSTVDYWARTRLIVPSQREKRPRLYSFIDLRDLVVAGQLRGQGAKVRDLRVALDYVRSVDQIDRLAQMNFHVFEGQLVYEPVSGVEAPHKKGQRVLTVNMAEVYRILGMESPEVLQMRPANRVLIDPSVRGGTPVVEGTRIPTRLIADLVTDDISREEILKMYPSLTAEDIDAALEWETYRRATG